jgi:outer membrane usher protein FimD/PapC
VGVVTWVRPDSSVHRVTPGASYLTVQSGACSARWCVRHHGSLVAADNAAAAWQELDLACKRAVIKTLMTITLRPRGVGTRRVFDPATVQVTRRQPG